MTQTAVMNVPPKTITQSTAAMNMVDWSQTACNLVNGTFDQFTPILFGRKDITQAKRGLISALALLLYYQEMDWEEEEIVELEPDHQSEDDLFKVPQEQIDRDIKNLKDYPFCLGGTPLMVRIAHIFVPLFDFVTGALKGPLAAGLDKEFARKMLDMTVLFGASSDLDCRLDDMFQNGITKWQIPVDLHVLARRIAHEFVEHSTEHELSFDQCIELTLDLEHKFMAEVEAGEHKLSPEDKEKYVNKIKFALSSRFPSEDEVEGY
ncbi:MAG: hypothetical protein IAB19_07770 [Proteobacteria bacterium]|uniref:Uncharacterized protein n=1 Tax=Candidatus Avisuccinivibrio stercorigallinarum TaxID=2840704 RepID=A0A9D9GT76_9GAMM|nr:hypothetical protein [Candidatus Avisuccinivibrio stercorigallinarum]